MIKDDAKFFFCLSGFTGFVLFFLVSSIIQKDTIVALVYGTGGCLVFSIFGRYLLGFILNGNMHSPSARVGDTASVPEAESPRKDRVTPRQERQKLTNNKKSVARTEANQGVKA
jgi:hypothetical protein